jgi:3-hydroxy-9,10-secoandrosta-1,3,5(10)-triene-9,17-dione monooxygenase
VTTSQAVHEPTREELLDRARALVPRFRERAARTEEARQCLPEAIEELFDAQLNRIAVPLKWGGFSHGYDLFLEVCAELSRGCGSTGWCYGLWGCHSWLSGHWPLPAQEEIYAGGPDVLIATAGYSTNARCEPAPGGYRISGVWEFSSGCDAASWVAVGGQSFDGRISMLVPKGEYEIVDNWRVLGLRGTGSKNIRINDGFVPQHRVRTSAIGDTDMTGWEIHGQRRYRMPWRCLIIWDLVAPMLGITQAMIDEFVLRMRASSGNKSADSQAIQIRLTNACAALDAGKALMRADVDEMMQQAGRGERFSDFQRARYDRDKAWIVHLCKEAVNSLYDVCGAHALFEDVPLQRIHRDANALPHRDGLVVDFAGENFGRIALGLPPK